MTGSPASARAATGRGTFPPAPPVPGRAAAFARRRFTIALTVLVAVAACAPLPRREAPHRPPARSEPTKAEQLLTSGIRLYENGDYENASRALQSALDDGLERDAQRVAAHKYLAFIHCVSGRERQCRDEFRRALDINPRMELEPAESGHPIWGPVFRSVKQQKRSP